MDEGNEVQGENSEEMKIGKVGKDENLIDHKERDDMKDDERDGRPEAVDNGHLW